MDRSEPGEPPQVAIVGMSVSETCGVRDHAMLLADAMASAGMACSVHWLTRRERSLRGARGEIGAWAQELASELGARPTDAILLHYSVFSYSHRGVPLFVRPVLAALGSSSAPLIVMLHEFVYPWRLGDWRGNVWAATQRMALIGVMRAASSVITTAEERIAWLGSRRWLPRRRALLAPVFSNLPAPAAAAQPSGQEQVIGLFGYSYQGAAVELILDALGRLGGDGASAHLRLLGAPGRDSPAGEAWLAAARRRGLEPSLSFSGALPAQSLSDELAACDVLLFADTAGPTSRKGSLAGSLASGRPVVALAGPQTWNELVDSRAICIAEPTAGGLAGALGGLLGDREAAGELGARGRRFAEREMALSRSVDAVSALLGEAVPATRPLDRAAQAPR